MHLPTFPSSLDGAGVSRSSNLLTPRQHDPLPFPSASNVGDFGILANMTSNEALFNHGLAGVNQPSNYFFAAVLGFTLAGVCALTLIFRWTRMGNAHIRHLFTMTNPERQRYWSRNSTSWVPWVKRHIMYAPLFRVRHNREIQISTAVSVGTMPSRFHFCLLAIYIACNVGYCLVLDWRNTNRASVLAELRGRSGELATMNLIPTVLFACRNNPLIPLLRVSYDTFNLFHRWCARIVTLEAIVHTLCFLINTSAGGMVEVQQSLTTSMSYQWGLVATCALIFICLLAFSPIRHAFYEVFVNTHRLLVLLGLIGVYIHIQKANLPQLPYVRAVICLWALEWAARLYHIVHYNISFRTGMTQVTVEALPAEACRVTFKLARPWKFVPGAHVHVYLPAIGLWSSHPFSVAWVESQPRALDLALDSSMEKALAQADAFGTKLQNSITESAMLQDSDYSSISTVSVIMRARTGMTRKLYDRVTSSATGRITLRGAIEGPYGGHESLSSYGTVLLFAGGVGITHCVPYVRYLLQQYAEGTCSCRKILLVWSVPNTEALEWVRPWMDQILRMQGRKDVLRIQLFITKPRHQGEIKSKTGTVQMFPGRCNASTIVDKEVAERIGAMGVVVCGPGAFADSVRSAVRQRVQVGSVDFVEEAFTY